MTTYGYARTATVEQIAGLADQIAKLKDADCTDQTISRVQVSNVRMDDRIEFAKVISALRRMVPHRVVYEDFAGIGF